MKLLQRYLVSEFMPVFIVALSFFVLLLQLIDLFTNLWRYLSYEVPLQSIVRVMILYLPKCISFAMPIAILFAGAYVMGSLYARNELTSVFSSGVPLLVLVSPLIVFGILLSFGMFHFEDRLVIHSLRDKNALNRVLLNQEETLSNNNVVVLSENASIVYTADYYQDTGQKLFSVLIVQRNPDGTLHRLVRAPSASWYGRYWELEDPQVYTLMEDSRLTLTRTIEEGIFTEDPELFRRNTTNVDELSARDARVFLDVSRRSGSLRAEHLADYYKRFSFPFTIAIVLGISLSIGGRFKKNILLMRLLLSLSVAVGFYVTQMVTMLFAKWEYISPLSGAWFPVILFMGIAALLLRFART